MKMLVCLTLAVSALAAPVLSFAQTTHDTITRAEVRTSAVGASVRPAAMQAPSVGPISFCNIYFGG